MKPSLTSRLSATATTGLGLLLTESSCWYRVNASSILELSLAETALNLLLFGLLVSHTVPELPQAKHYLLNFIYILEDTPACFARQPHLGLCMEPICLPTASDWCLLISVSLTYSYITDTVSPLQLKLLFVLWEKGKK